MRSLGTLPHVQLAQRFCDYALTERVDCSFEHDPTDGIQVWVHEEDDFSKAKELFGAFQHAPGDPRFDVAREAKQLRRSESQRKAAVRRNRRIVRWSDSPLGRRRTPITILVIVTCILFSLLTDFGRAASGSFGEWVFATMQFVNYRDYIVANEHPAASLLKGELWRAITPIFLHGSMMHLILNLVGIGIYLRIIERLHGMRFTLLIVFATGLLSSLGQGLMPPDAGGGGWARAISGSPFFVGISGVVCGLFGFLWIRPIVARDYPVHIPDSGIVYTLLLLVLFATPWSPISNVANVAHFAGLLAGVAIAFLPDRWIPTRW
jgi:GlpG protein